MISLCMIVKNEENFIESCLKSVAGYVDDIVIADTGSTDGTKEIAQKFGARVFDFEWVDDFAAARNFAASQAKYDWIFVLDADEEVISFDKKYIDDFTKDSLHVGCIEVYHHNIGGLTYKDRLGRLYNSKQFTFCRKIHEMLSPLSGDHYVKYVDTPIAINHYGYSTEVMKSKNKAERNIRLLEKELLQTPNDPNLLYHMGKAYFAIPEGAGKAVEYFEKALEQIPNTAYEYVYTLIERYGYALLRIGEYKKSMDLLKYLEIYGHKPHFRFLLAHIYQNNGKLLEALECYESCLMQNDADTTGVCSYLSYYNIGVILEVTGMLDNAKAYYMQCGDYEPALKRLAELK